MSGTNQQQGNELNSNQRSIEVSAVIAPGGNAAGTQEPGGHVAKTAQTAKSSKPSKPSKSARSSKSAKEAKTFMVKLIDEAGTEVWCSEEGRAYATIHVNGHREHHAIESNAYNDYVARLYYNATGEVPVEEALKRTSQILRGRAIFDGAVHDTHVRLARAGEAIYIDLGDETWDCIEISPSGVRMICDPPVRFRRRAGMHALPRPTQGSIEQLRPFVNIADEDFPLLVGALVSAYHPTGPYPILILQGPQGVSKSTIARVFLRLTDPSSPDLRGEPRSHQDLMVTARNNRVIALDNLSGTKQWLADSLCRIATGGGHAVRKLYTEAEETIFQATRPLVMTGIGEVGEGTDLRDRAIVIEPLLIRPEDRQTEQDFWARFNAESPAILGAILEGVRTALVRSNSVQLDTLPRMADAARWVTAAESAFGWEHGTFVKNLHRNEQRAVETALETHPVGHSVRVLLHDVPEWTGTATDLLQEVGLIAPQEIRKSNVWPKSPASVSEQLTRLEPALRHVGIEVERSRTPDASRQRLIHLRRVGESTLRIAQTAYRPYRARHPHRTVKKSDAVGRQAVATKVAPTLLSRITKLGRGMLGNDMMD